MFQTILGTHLFLDVHAGALPPIHQTSPCMLTWVRPDYLLQMASLLTRYSTCLHVTDLAVYISPADGRDTSSCLKPEHSCMS